MDKELLFYQDIMSQQFSIGTYYNATRYLLLYAMIDSGKFEAKYTISELVDKVFDIYCFNKSVAIHHPNIEIRRIPCFGMGSIRKDIIEALVEWRNMSKSQVLLFDDNYLFVLLNDEDGHVAKQAKQILDILFYKNFKIILQNVPKPNFNILRDDTNLEKFGVSYYRNKVFSDMQYCILCDNCVMDDLVVVHILPASLCNRDEMLFDKNNGLIMCRNHATAYVQRKFYFDLRGKVIAVDGNPDYFGMRLSIHLLKNRKNYIEEYAKSFEKT